MDLHSIRAEYSQQTLSQSQCDPNPLKQCELWLQQAISAKVNEPTAMNVATVQNGKPTSRMVLLKELTAEGFVFFTNYESQKGQAITSNPAVALTFFWAELERQIRVEGEAVKLSVEESDRYFHSRPRTSQLGAWASRQSQPLKSKAELLAQLTLLTARYPIQIPRPPHWGGYLVKPIRFEFWQGRPSRLHDRICYQFEQGTWKKVRLSP